MGTEIGGTHFGGGGRGHKPRSTSCHWKPRKDGNRCIPPRFQKESALRTP